MQGGPVHHGPEEPSPHKFAFNVFVLSFAGALLTIGVVIYLVLLGGGAQLVESLVPQASSFAPDIDFVIVLVAVLVGFWFFAALGTFFFLLVRFRHRPGGKAEYLASHEHALERWVSWPHFLIIACDILIIAAAVRVWVHVKQVLPPPESTVRVIGQQWAWTFVDPGLDNELDTPDDIRVVDELHLVKDRTYQFELTATDVLHSFGIPVFRLKQDAVPGRVIKGWFRPTKLGKWDIQCVEICGIGHGLMHADLYVETPEQHAAWLAAQKPLTASR